MISPMLNAELAQARGLAAKAANEREMYIRICALLVKAIESGTADALVRVDGHIAVRAEAFLAVPNLYRVDARATTAKVDGADPNAAEENVLVIEVKDREPKPILVMARST